jgi:hypothetical protein
MFRVLLAHPQEVLHKRNLVYCVRIMPVGCGTITVFGSGSSLLVGCQRPGADTIQADLNHYQKL